jgi:hypothetical protein
MNPEPRLDGWIRQHVCQYHVGITSGSCFGQTLVEFVRALHE